MKKIVAWILCLCLIAIGVPALAASAGVLAGSTQPGEELSARAFTYDAEQDKLYVLGYEAFYTLNADGSDFRQWSMPDMTLESQGDMPMYFNWYGVYLIDGTLYALGGYTAYSTDGGDARIEDYGLYTLSFDEAAGNVSAELSVEFDGERFIDYSGGYVNINMPDQTFVMDGKIYGTNYISNGQGIVICNPQDGSIETTEVDGYLNSVFAYKDGRLLAVKSDYADGQTTYSILSLDPHSGDMEELCKLNLDANTYPDMFFYDPQTDYFYYVAGGELFRFAGLDAQSAISVSACPITYSSGSAFDREGDLILLNSNMIVRVNTDPEERPEKRLVVQYQYNQSLEAARTDFQKAHPEVEVVLADNASEIVQAMMTQASDVDIYTLSVDSSAYSAVFNRGYMAELTGSELLSSTVSAMYPALQALAIKDGELYAVPVSMNRGIGLSYNTKAFQQLGLTEQDLPTTWKEYFELLQRLPDYLANDEDISVFDSYYTQAQAREMLFYKIMDDYLLFISQPGNEFAFDTPLFRELMAELDSVDFAALGLKEESEESGWWDYNINNVLLGDYGSFGAYVNSGVWQNLYLSLDEGVEPMVPVSVEVAFVNPFSQNRELAIEYLEYAVENLDDITRVHMMPGENEPVLNTYYEEGLKSYDDQIASLEKQLAAADDVDKQALETQLEEMKGYRDEYEALNRYTASEESIAEYREYADYITPMTYVGMDNETSQEYYDQINQYLAGSISLDEFIRNIDQKLKMIVLEGQ